ncbi:hypothetical protein BWI93_16015 [Siphonobacter sp. BAB-5385]|uniref:LVIVD repeat-containing protein n=1 Tax=Siphonobacter sp. BAB-5385 TaxID=1864822 RepID=UPI000B9E487F|nr:hypothetical protein [Siphonobacter sp. BAB-5385]OZI07174.1 hypothetical protein BWI93_16015 [Siphonobacter sp. BAB-5385]
MKKPLLVFILATFGLSSCEDQCQQTRVYRQLSPFQVSLSELRQNGVAIQEATGLENPGKIYAKDNFLFINEVKKGIHIIDNTDPANPVNVSFIRILGNADMAVKGNTLYADSYTDFLVFDISNPRQPLQLQRITNAFQSGMVEGISWSTNAVNWGNSQQEATTIIDYTPNLITQVTETDCEGNTTNPGGWGGWMNFASSSMYSDSKSSGGGQGSGTGGSMARFAIVNNILYAVTNQNMQLFDITQPKNPQKGNVVTLGWGIETIYPYKDRLYVGSTTGMHILSNADPNNPVRVSTLSHVRACDPVVVHDTYAFVTLRAQQGSATCGPAQNNQLDVIDVSNMYSPKLLKSFPMQEPYGLGVDHPTLFVCEGKYGLKSYDVSDPLQLDKKLLNHFKGMDAYDVIPLNTKVLMLIGKDGFYQYDYSNRNNPRLLSKIPVRRKDL